MVKRMTSSLEIGKVYHSLINVFSIRVNNQQQASRSNGQIKLTFDEKSSKRCGPGLVCKE